MWRLVILGFLNTLLAFRLPRPVWPSMPSINFSVFNRTYERVWLPHSEEFNIMLLSSDM